MKKILMLITFVILTSNVFSQTLKKVVILDFINIEGSATYNYLEASITDSVEKMLKEKFAFSKMNKKNLKKLIKKNFIFRKDFYTQTASMNIGLLAKQDVVISGGFKIKVKNKNTIINIHVVIYDMKNKKVISDFKMEGPADSRIWDTIGTIVKKISLEAKKVLPNKSDWKSQEIEEPGEPFFATPVLGIKSGGALYTSGYADRIKANQPIFELMFRGNIPVIWDKLTLGGVFSYVKHTWKKDFNDITESMNLETNNYITGLFLGADISLSENFGLNPHLGGGYIFQDTTITGETNYTGSNSFPFAGAGLDISYKINDFLDAVFTVKTISEFETGTMTLLHSVLLGVNLRL
jgi:hypothetical protein